MSELKGRAEYRLTVCRDLTDDVQKDCSIIREQMETIDRLTTQLTAKTADNERLREALEWYRDQAENCRKIGGVPEGDLARSNLDRDGGKRASQALAAHEKGTEQC